MIIRFLLCSLSCALLAWGGAASLALAHAPDLDVQDLPAFEELLLTSLGGEVQSTSEPVKCGTWILETAHAQRDQLSAVAREALESWEAAQLRAIRAKAPASYDSPEGHFVIEYDDAAVSPVDDDLSGVPDYVEWVSEAMEESWTYTVDTLGFPAPPLGPGERYRVSLQPSSFYGFTSTSGDPVGGTYIVINGDFEGFYQRNPSLTSDDPDGPVRGAIRVTAIHEFKHASQYIESNWSEAGLWNEVDATWMEEMGYDQVNDYYNYLTNSSSPFVAPSVSLSVASYDDSTWQHYLTQRYGVSLLRDFGDRRAQVLATERPELTFRAVAEADGIDWAELWREYGVWNYLSGSRSTATLGFEEAANYPTSALASTLTELPFQSLNLSLPSLAFAFHQIENGTRTATGGIEVSFSGDNEEWVASLVFQNSTQTVWRPMNINASGEGTLEVTDLDLADFDRIALVVGNATVGNTTTLGNYAFSFGAEITVTRTALRIGPSPFGHASPLNVSFTLPRSGTVSVQIYDLRGRQVRELVSRRTLQEGLHGPYIFDGLDDSGQRLPSGVYLVRTQAPGIDDARRVSFLK